MKRKIIDARGFTLVEVSLAAGLAIGVILLLAQYFSNQHQMVKWMRVVSARDAVRARLDRAISDPRFITKSQSYSGTGYEGNAALHLCVNPTLPETANCNSAAHTNCCKATTSSAPQPFMLVSLDSTNLAGTDAASGGSLTATSLLPVAYDDQGEPCGPAASYCPIEAVASYIATCSTGSQCAKPTSVKVQYTIRQTPGVVVKGGPALNSVTVGAILGASTAASATAGAAIPTYVKLDYTDGAFKSYQIPDNVTRIQVELWGAGGGGARSTGGDDGTGGGGGGAYARLAFDVTPNSYWDYQIGAGGAAGAQGASTRFGHYDSTTKVFSGVTAAGGNGGTCNGGSYLDGLGGSGGSATSDAAFDSGVVEKLDGAPGASAYRIGGRGGSSPKGGSGGRGGDAVAAKPGIAGTVPGGGGGGGFDKQAGGVGANGAILISY